MEETYFCWTTLITSAPRIINVISHLDTEQVEPDIRIPYKQDVGFLADFLASAFSRKFNTRNLAIANRSRVSCIHNTSITYEW